MPETRQPRVAGRIDPAMNPMQTTGGDPVRNRARPEAEVHELPAADDAVLAVGNASDRPLVWARSGVGYVLPRISCMKQPTKEEVGLSRRANQRR